MALVNLGKTVSNNVTGNYTPGGLIPALLTGAYEVNRGLGNISLQPPQGIGDGNLWILTWKWTDPAVSVFTIAYDAVYGVGRFGAWLWGGEQNPGEYNTLFYANNGRHTAVISWGRETGEAP